MNTVPTMTDDAAIKRLTEFATDALDLPRVTTEARLGVSPDAGAHWVD